MLRDWKTGILLAAFAFVLMFQLGSYNVTIMEARNFVTAREMWTDGHILIPTLNGEYRLQKPPLPTWLTALSGSLAKEDLLFWLRFPAALLALITLFYVQKISRLFRTSQEDGGSVALILITSFYFFLMARSGMWDIYAQCFALMGIYYYIRMMRVEHPRVLHGIFFALLLAASFMSKGPVALYGLFLPFLLAFHLFGPDRVSWSAFKRNHLIGAVLLAVLLASLWPMYIYFSDAGKQAAEILQEESANWSSYNVRPFYYYWSFPVQSGIWTIFGFVGLVFCALKYKQLRGYAGLKFYFWWTLFVVILLSLIPEKKSRYLLPVLFPMAFFIAQWVNEKDWQGSTMLVRICGLVTSIILTGMGGVLIANPIEATDLLSMRIPAGVLLLGFGLFSTFLFYNNRNIPGVWGIGGAVLVAIPFVIADIGRILDAPDPVHSFSTFSTETNKADVALYSIGEIRPELVWHVGRKVPEIKHCTIPDTTPLVGVFSFYEIDTICPQLWNEWEVISTEFYDQNPKESLKKPNPALTRYFWMIRKIDQ